MTNVERGHVSPVCLRLYVAILEHWQEHGLSPTMRDLAERTGRSACAVFFKLPELEAHGLIRPRLPHKAAAIVPAMRLELWEEAHDGANDD